MYLALKEELTGKPRWGVDHNLIEITVCAVGRLAAHIFIARSLPRDLVADEW